MMPFSALKGGDPLREIFLYCADLSAGLGRINDTGDADLIAPVSICVTGLIPCLLSACTSQSRSANQMRMLDRTTQVIETGPHFRQRTAIDAETGIYMESRNVHQTSHSPGLVWR